MNCRADLFWLLERIMPRLHERAGGDKPVHVLGIADPASIPQVLLVDCMGWLQCLQCGTAMEWVVQGCALVWCRCGCQLRAPALSSMARLATETPSPLHSFPCPPPPTPDVVQLATYGSDTFDSCYPTLVLSLLHAAGHLWVRHV